MKAERISRKMVLIGLITILLCFVGGTIAFAGIPRVGGDEFCDLCHQEGNGGGGKPLLPDYQGNDGCVYCHSHATSSTTYTLSGGGQTVTVPVVNFTGSTAPSSYLAGGNFYWVQIDGQDDQGHNIFASNPDPLTGAPGLAYGCSNPADCHANLHNDTNPGPFGIRQGCTKCHMLYNGGDLTGGSPSGYHHADDSELVVGSSAFDDDGYFRFLDSHILCSAVGSGVCGIEDVDWQATSSSTDHNEYLGNEAYLDRAGIMAGVTPQGHTMTGYCGGCHGNFHQSSPYEAGGDWIRHPAGRVLPSGGEFDDYDTFDPAAPVARPDLSGFTGPESDVDSGVDLANCLSCHRAHGSPYPKMLRWDPADTSEAGRCVACHTKKVTGTDGQYHYSSVADCTVCHTMHGDGAPDYGTNDNEALVAEVIATPNSGDKDVTFPSGGASDYISDASPWKGVCQVCHTDTNYYQNDGTSPGGAHHEGEDCLTCHSHSDEFLHSAGDPGATCMDPACHGYPSHATHFDSTGKGPGIPLTEAGCYICHADPLPAFKDDEPFATTTVCDECHSPLGAFPESSGLDDPDIGAKANWPDDFTVSPEGIYEADGVTLKSGKEEWCTTCHDNQPASSRPGPGAEVIVDNPDATFVCTWGTSSTGGYNGDYRWHAAGDGSCTATWTPNLPSADTYNVYAWWKASTNRATDAPYTIYYDGGSETVDVNQQINGNQWNLLGTYPFAAGTSGYVVLSDDANQYVIADAIKLDNGSGEATTNAPNVSGDNIDYGFYVTGHKINCLSCHDASKKHIDHEHRTYEVDDSSGVAINPYADSYRLTVPTNKPSRYLCFVCHNSTEVLGQTSSDVSHTNFWNNDSYVENSHWLHVGFTGIHFDSDWDGVVDSTESCITCHNVHGSPTEAMIRHGELISTYGTTDKVPALNFSYLG